MCAAVHKSIFPLTKMGSRPDFDSPDKASAGIIDPRTAAASKMHA
jgi:hypothetical protein